MGHRKRGWGLAICLAALLLPVAPVQAQTSTSTFFTYPILGQEFGSVPCGSGLMLDKFGGWYLPILAGATAADFELDVCHPDFPLSGSTPITGWFTRVADLPASSAATLIQGHLTPITNPACSPAFALDFSGQNGAFAIQTTTPTTRGPTIQPPYGALEVCQGSAGPTVGGVVAMQLLASAGIGTWTATGSLHQDRANGATAVLDDGTVLVAGGTTNQMRRR